MTCESPRFPPGFEAAPSCDLLLARVAARTPTAHIHLSCPASTNQNARPRQAVTSHAPPRHSSQVPEYGRVFRIHREDRSLVGMVWRNNSYPVMPLDDGIP